MKKEYIIYKGDQPITLGTVAECAKYLEVSRATITMMATPKWRKLYGDTEMLVAYLIEDDNEGEIE